MEALIILIVLGIFVLPIIALVIAFGARGRVKELARKVEVMRIQVDDLTTRLKAGGKTSGNDGASAEKTATDKPSKAAATRQVSVDADEKAATDAVSRTQKAPEPAIASASDQPKKQSDVFQGKVPPRSSAGEPIKSAASVSPKLSAPQGSVVFNANNGAKLREFIGEYWAYILGALSMMLGGIYLVRLGIEKNLITPTMRVAFAVLVGVIFIYIAERMRRRFGDDASSGAAYIPSIFAATGFTTIYGALIGATSLYGLISVETAFIALVIVALIAIIAGRHFGLLLSALGALGAYLAPLIIGEASPIGFVMLGYALVIMATVMIVDSAKRSGWLTVWGMTLCAIFAAGVIAGRPFDASIFSYGIALLVFVVAYLALVIIIPERRLVPRYDFVDDNDPTLFPSFFPARLVFGAQIVVVTGFVIATGMLFGVSQVPLLLTLILFVGIYFFWLGNAPALTVLPMVPIGLALFWVASAALNGQIGFANEGGLFATGEARIAALIGVTISMITALYSYRVPRLRQIWALISIAFPVAYVVLLALNWHDFPSSFIQQLDNSVWLLILGVFGLNSAALFFYHRRALGMEARMVELAALPLVVYVFIAGTLLPGQYTLLFTVVAIALWAVWIVLKLNWSLHGLVARAASIGVIYLYGVSFVYFPLYGDDADYSAYLLERVGIGAVIALISYGVYRFIDERDDNLRIYFEAQAFLIASIAALLLTLDIIVIKLGIDAVHVLLGLYFLFFLAQVMAIRHRMQAQSAFNAIRRVGVVFYGLIAGVFFASLIFANPFVTGEYISGTVLFNSMAIAYGLPALVIGFLAKRGYLGKFMRIGYWVAAGLLGALFLMNVRMFWQGNVIDAGQPMGQGELFSYTILMLLGMIATMYLAITRRSSLYRRIALGLLLAVAVKTYFIDLAQFDNALRTASLFILGLLLIGFSFIDRKTRALTAIGADQGARADEPQQG